MVERNRQPHLPRLLVNRPSVASRLVWRSESSGEHPNVRQSIDGFDLGNRVLYALAPHCELRAIKELLVQFLARERPLGSTPVALVGGLDQPTSIGQIDFDDAPNLVEAAGLDRWIEDRRHVRHHLLNWRAAYELIGKFLDTRLAPDRDGGQQERQAEFGLELGFRRLVP